MIPLLLFQISKLTQAITQTVSYIIGDSATRYGTVYNGYMEADSSYPTNLGSIVGQYFVSYGKVYRVTQFTYIFFSGNYRLIFSVKQDAAVLADGLPICHDHIFVKALGKRFYFIESYSGPTNSITEPSQGFGWYLNNAEFNTMLNAKPNYFQYNTLPGVLIPVAGDTENGFYGEVSSASFISGSDLASQVGVTQGVAMNSNTPWLKFSYHGKTLYVSRYPIQHSISWSHLNSLDLVYGDRIITIKGLAYKVRLMQGASADPSNQSGREWDYLLYKIRGVSSTVWFNYSDSDLGMGGSLLGRVTWCQETRADDNSRRIQRGSTGVTHFGNNLPDTAASFCGWRPVLELVE